jgi:ADP-heptose:LPS heptosyltransferase
MKLKLKLFFDYYLGGLLHVLLKPPTVLLGKVLRRDHNLANCTSVTVLKLLGGGSLVGFYPELLALRRNGRIQHFRLVTSPAVRQFGESLHVFDEIIVIRDKSLMVMAMDTLTAIVKLFRCPAMIDLEIHSRLTTVFTLLTCARNRVGFFTAMSFWRKGLATHLLFCNASNSIHDSYEQLVKLFGATPPDFATCSQTFRKGLGLAEPPPRRGRRLRLGITPCCSGLSTERMLLPEEWVEVVGPAVAASGSSGPAEIHLFGAPSDRPSLEKLAALLTSALPVTVINHGGKSLHDSLLYLNEMDQIFSIDSALLHFARLLGKPTVSFWGPTDPQVLLRPSSLAPECIHYQKLSCSPCVHLVDQPPCKGDNLCMRSAVNPIKYPDRNPLWVVE